MSVEGHAKRIDQILAAGRPPQIKLTEKQAADLSREFRALATEGMKRNGEALGRGRAGTAGMRLPHPPPLYSPAYLYPGANQVACQYASFEPVNDQPRVAIKADADLYFSNKVPRVISIQQSSNEERWLSLYAAIGGWGSRQDSPLATTATTALGYQMTIPASPTSNRLRQAKVTIDVFMGSQGGAKPLTNLQTGGAGGAGVRGVCTLVLWAGRNVVTLPRIFLEESMLGEVTVTSAWSPSIEFSVGMALPPNASIIASLIVELTAWRSESDGNGNHSAALDFLQPKDPSFNGFGAGPITVGEMTVEVCPIDWAFLDEVPRRLPH